MYPADQTLEGLRVVVTRPEHQAAKFISLLEQSGAIAVRLPTIVIVYKQAETLKPEQVNTAVQGNYWIFTSANAVIGAVKCNLLPRPENSHSLPKIKIAAIGQATRRCLEEYKIAADLAPPDNSTTEQFIELFGEHFNKQDRVTIVRGDSGREELKKRLISKGCAVTYLCVYQRQLPDMQSQDVIKTLNKAMPCVISVTSDQGLSNLLQLIPEEFHSTLFNCSLVVNSQRCAAFARQAGFHNKLVIASPPGDNGQIKALFALNK